MPVQVLYPRFKATLSDGKPAAGYRLHTYLAGTTTPATTYSDHLLTVPNSNPVVLDYAGEAVIYTRVPLKLVLRDTTGQTVMTQDWVGRELGNPPLLAATVSGTQHNRYTATTDPTVTELADGQQVTFIPDVDAIDTIVETAFSGSGINDARWQGPYVGTTSGSTFVVQIDGVKFQGSGLNDLVWGGTPAKGFTYTVKIDATGTPDKFIWRKGGGQWSSQINITGDWQELTDGVMVKFGQTTGHTVGDTWNVVDSFRWRKDNGDWTTGVAITCDWQSLIEGVKVRFSTPTGHTLNDSWSATVDLPVTFKLNEMDRLMVYKNVGGDLQALDGGDLKAGIPTTLSYSSSISGWFLMTPQVPVWGPETLQRLLDRVEVIGDTTLSSNEHGKEIACNNSADITLTLPVCNTVAGVFYDIKACGDGHVTLQASGSDKIFYPLHKTGASKLKFTLYCAPYSSLRIATDGVDWHVLFMALKWPLESWTYNTAGSGTWTNPGYNKIKVTIAGAGGGGGGSNSNYGGSGGGGGGWGWKVIDVSQVASVNFTVGGGGTGGTPGQWGAAGGTTSFGTYITASGGGGGGPNGGTPGSGGGCTGGDANYSGSAGQYGTTSKGGNGGASYGSGGAGGSTDADGAKGADGGGGGGGGPCSGRATSGGNGGNGFVIVEVVA